MTAETLIRQQGGLVKTLNGIILDPPRTGLSREMLRWLVDQGPSRLLYFSCDFPTFHRDLKHLQRAYQFASTLFVSNVPGTLRVETALELQRHGG
jgi:23S rRNA (uracil1939-C5)-methyltransferase